MLQGLGLGGVLALVGVWARLVHGRGLPHLGVGACAGVLAALGFRFAAAPAALGILGLVVLGGVLGAGLALVDGRARRAPVAGGGLALRGDVAVLALLLALAALARPAMSVALPFGPLGGWPGPAGSITAGLLGAGGAALLGMGVLAVRGRAARWALAGALLGATVGFASGTGLADGMALTGVAGVPDTAGLALRAFAVGLAARRGWVDGVVAGLVLGVGESLLAVIVPVAGAGMAVPILAVAAGLLVHVQPWPQGGEAA